MEWGRSPVPEPRSRSKHTSRRAALSVLALRVVGDELFHELGGGVGGNGIGVAVDDLPFAVLATEHGCGSQRVGERLPAVERRGRVLERDGVREVTACARSDELVAGRGAVREGRREPVEDGFDRCWSRASGTSSMYERPVRSAASRSGAGSRPTTR
jgi:hypothetical protein